MLEHFFKKSPDNFIIDFVMSLNKMTKCFPPNKIQDYYRHALLIGFIACVLFWMIDAFIQAYFRSGLVLSQLFLMNRYGLWIRFLVSMLLLLYSFTVAYFLRQKLLILNLENCTFQTLHAIGNAAFITNRENKILFVNQKYTDITGYTVDEVLGKNPNILSSGKQDKAFYKELWTTLCSTGYWEGEIWNRKKSGEVFPEWINISVIKDNHGKPCNYLAIFSDISIKKEVEEKVIHYAYYDPLTNLPNRRFFNEQLKQAIVLAKRNQQKLTVLFIDLDDFKKINDQLGHDVGDVYLCKVALLIKDKLRKSDMVARFGGDEFVILLSSTPSKEAALEFTQTLLTHLETTVIQIKDNQLFVKASIGCAIYPDDAIEAKALIQYADRKMYEIKAVRKKSEMLKFKERDSPHSGN